MPFTKGHTINLGKKRKPLTSELRLRISQTLKRKGIKPPSQKGVSPTLEVRRKLSEAIKGEKHYNWKGGVTKMNLIIRRSLEYRLWRETVFARDNWTCVFCGVRGGHLEADHIKPFALYPELRFAIDNGRTLCRPCHITTFKNAKE